MKKIKLWMFAIIGLIICAHFWVTYNKKDPRQNIEHAKTEVITLPDLVPQNDKVEVAPTEKYFSQLFEQKKSAVQVTGEGVVIKILADDNEGSRHQKFILGVDEGITLLITHNIDLAPRIDNLNRGDVVKFNGEYVWNDKGGLIHWTHKDPQAVHQAGYLEHKGKVYQ